MRPFAGRCAMAVAVMLTTACHGLGPFSPESDPKRGMTAGSALRTDATSYLLEPVGSGLSTQIGISFTNASTRRMYIVNCHGGLSTTLEKRVNGSWVPYWSPILLMCLSPPIIIEPGATLTRTINVWGAPPGTNAGPAWAAADVEGTYRMVLGSVVWNYTTQGQSFGQPVPLEVRTSNQFTLRR
jgi:hypothetical protein